MDWILIILFSLCLLACSLRLTADDLFASADQKAKELSAISGYPVNHWRYNPGDLANAWKPSFDDSGWSVNATNDFKAGEGKTAWLRTSVKMPEEIDGIKVAGNAVLLKCRVRADDDGVLYVNGKQAQTFYSDEGRVLLSLRATPGEEFDIAVQSIDAGGDGSCGLAGAWLVVQATEEIPFLLATYDYAKQMSSLAEEGKHKEYGDCILTGMEAVDIDALRAGKTEVFVQSVKSAISQMGYLDEVAKGLTIHLIGHAHIDMNWTWDWPETLRVCRNTFNTAFRLMDAYPDFVLSQSQAAVYLAMQENHPEVFEEIKKRVKRGQWDITASTWTESDYNMSSGEGIVRSILYAKRYIKQEFGVEPVVCWSPDTFGHPWTLPQILSKSGIKYYYFTRCDVGLPIFWWQSPDGSRILAYRTMSYDNAISDHVATDALLASRKTGLTHFMRVFGVGDHGGGPTRAMLDYARRLQARSGFPKTVFDTTPGYFEYAAKTDKGYPVWNNEMNTVFEATYTTHSDAKLWNRKSEALLPCAEKFSAIALAQGGAYPANGFEKSWRSVCFNQFHDLLCGTSIHGSHEYSNKLNASATRQAGKALEASLKALTARIHTEGKGVPIVVFNPLSWARSESVEVTSPFPGEVGCFQVRDDRGLVSCAQNRGGRLCFTARNVPALGYKVLWASRATKAVTSKVGSDSSIVENEFFRVAVDLQTGTLTSIFDKVNERELLPSGERGAKLQMLLEEPQGKSAWRIGKILGQEDLLIPTHVSPGESGPARASISFSHKYGGSSFAQEVVLYDGVPRIDLKMTADWREVGDSTTPAPLLKIAFPTSLKNARASFEIPFGSIERPTDGKEVPAQKWVDLSETDYGVSILNDCKYGFSVDGSVIRGTVLRTPYFPDPKSDVGRHKVTYSIYPHKGGWREAGTVRRGYELNEPLIARLVDSHHGPLPSEMSYVSLSAPNLVVTALKQAEDGDGTIIRFYESSGLGCRARVNVALPAGHYLETDLMERHVGKKTAIRGGAFDVSIGKWEIKTYKLTQ